MALSEGDYCSDKDGFLAAFERARREVLDAIHRGSNPLEKAVARATVLAAIPTLASPAHVLRIDFATGAVEQGPLAYAAIGTLPSEFQITAETVLAECACNSPNAEALALECMRRAIVRCPDNVGWPIDVWTVKSGAQAGKTHSRLDPRTVEEC